MLLILINKLNLLLTKRKFVLFIKICPFNMAKRSLLFLLAKLWRCWPRIEAIRGHWYLFASWDVRREASSRPITARRLLQDCDYILILLRWRLGHRACLGLACWGKPKPLSAAACSLCGFWTSQKTTERF